jgi:DNA-binding response OmpR family regulator
MRILVVEDERKIARLIQKGLKELGFAVDLIGRGDEALEIILYNPFEAIVLDIMLPGRVFTRTQLCQHVWEYQFDAGTNLVEVYIQRLRRKVDDSEPAKLIQTVRGAGYRIGDST